MKTPQAGKMPHSEINKCEDEYWCPENRGLQLTRPMQQPADLHGSGLPEQIYNVRNHLQANANGGKCS